MYKLIFAFLFAGACLAAPAEDVVAPDGAIKRIPIINDASPELQAAHKFEDPSPKIEASHKLEPRFELKPEDPVKIKNGWGGFAAKGQCNDIRMRLSVNDLDKFKKNQQYDGPYDDSLMLAANCPDFAGSEICNVLQLSDCITVQSGYLVPSNSIGGDFHKVCKRCELNEGTILQCKCTNADNGFFRWASIDLDDIVHNINGQMNCLQAHSKTGPDHCPPKWNFQLEDLM